MSRTRTAYTLLGILAIHDHQSGYELRKTIESSVGFFWGESYGQIYPTLKRMQAESLVTARALPGRRRGQEYSITPAGRALLRDWLAAPFRMDPPRDEFLLKLFFGAEADPQVSIQHLLDFQQRHRSLLQTFTQLESLARVHNAHLKGFPYWMLTLSYGKAQIESALAWSESALASLSRAAKKAASQQA
ncbi:MAG TPA: PadR family transcriptional regulator [Terracidiphilus sp.]